LKNMKLIRKHIKRQPNLRRNALSRMRSQKVQ